MTNTDSSVWRDYCVYRVHSSASKVVVCENDAQHTPIFFTNPSLYKGKKNKPDIRLYAVQPSGLNAAVNIDGRKISAAEGKASPIIASAHFRSTGRKIGLTFGDPSRPDALHWESMHQENFSGGRYSFTIPPANAVTSVLHFTSSFSTDYSVDAARAAVTSHSSALTDPFWHPVPSKTLSTITATTQREDSSRPSSPDTTARQSKSPRTSPALQGRSLTWKRTHSVELLPDVSNLSRRLSLSNRKLVDNQTGEVLALFESLALRGLRHLGMLRVRKDLVAGLADMELGFGKSNSNGSEDTRWTGCGSAAEASVMLMGIVLSWCVIEERVRRDG